MQTVKVRKAIPLWIIALIVVCLVVSVVFAVGASGLVGDFFGDLWRGLQVLAGILATGIWSWGSINMINGTIVWIGMIVGLGAVFLMIAKRRYLVAEKMLVPGVQQAFEPQSQLSAAQLYANPTSSAPEQTAPAPPVAEEKKEA